MKLAYVDTSCLVAIYFDEPGAESLSRKLESYDRLFASNLLEAEFFSTLSREGISNDGEAYLSWLSWVYPNRPLTWEFRRIISMGNLKGADLWHLAIALFLSPRTEEMAFLSLDLRQAEIAARLGFPGLKK